MRGRILLSLLAVLFVAGCGRSDPPQDFVARLGDRVLTQDELSNQLRSLSFTEDSLEARQQIIEQWLTNELLYREARRRGLRNNRDVQRLLADNERSVLVSTLISRMYDEMDEDVDDGELLAYYERSRERLQLREPFVQVRYLSTMSGDDAAEVRHRLSSPPAGETIESVWSAAVRDVASDPSMSRVLSETFTAESRLFVSRPEIRSRLLQLNDGQVAPIIETDSLFHVLQLVQRVPAGSIPQFEWIRDELQHRLRIEARKQMYARQVQRLRTEAMAREDLEIR